MELAQNKLEEAERKLLRTNQHCGRVIKERDYFKFELKTQTKKLRSIIVSVRKELLKIKSEKFELGIKYHNVSERLMY